jgi:class 3 adenylate cyclase
METSPSDVWHCATRAELALLLDDPDVETHYKNFRTAAGTDFGVVFSANKQADLILIKKWLPEDSLDEFLHVPYVVVFAGHMVDPEGHEPPRFPASLEAIVREQLEKTLETLDVGIAFASAAFGSDILFLEAMLARDKEYHLVLPPSPETFTEKSVIDIGGSASRERFDKVLAGAASVTIANPQHESLSPTLLHFGNQLVYGMAKIRARTIGSSLNAMAVWNEKPGRAEGGTASSVEIWKAHGEDVLVLNPFPRAIEIVSPSLPASAPSLENEIRAILFADIVGYSKLNENDIPLYAKHFLGELGALVDQSPNRPLTKNTWGDALYFVFDNIRNAAFLALEIQSFVCEPGKWIKLGFSKDLSLRTALHAGPVYSIFDGITGRQTYYGANVNRAARIEATTQEGQIFVSEQFAALVEAEGIPDFHCDYVGEKELPKKSGRIRAHILRSASHKSSHEVPG